MEENLKVRRSMVEERKGGEEERGLVQEVSKKSNVGGEGNGKERKGREKRRERVDYKKQIWRG